MKTRSYLFISAIFLLSHCANEIAPTGGTKDSTPPKLVKSSPPNENRHFTSRKIVLSFDEFLNYSLNIPEIQITPELKPAPKYYVQGKRLYIDLPKKLDSNITYNIQFGNSIKDINEGNALNNLSYCFSTGDSLDIALVSGSVISLTDLKPMENVLIGIYTPSSSFEKPLYFTRTNKTGDFTLSNIKRGSYRIAGFEDKNLNRIYDRGDGQSGFLDSLIILNDTINHLKLSLFPQKNGNIVDRVIPSGNKLKIAFTHAIDKVSIVTDPKNEIEFASLNDDRDTLIYWYKNKSLDSITISIIANDSTSQIKVKNESAKDSLFIYSGKKVVASPLEKISISFTNPIKSINRDNIKIIEDSVKPISGLVISTDQNENQLILNFPKKEDHRYTVILEDSTIEDIFGKQNKRDTIRLSTSKESDNGNLILKLNDNDTAYLIVELRNEKEQIFAKRYLSPAQKSVKILQLPKGNYKVIGIIDENRNGYWDSGNFDQRKQAEKKVILKSSIEIKGGWDIEAEIKLKNPEVYEQPKNSTDNKKGRM